MSDEKKLELCEVCKKAEMTGAVFLIRLRTSKEREKASPGRNLCDGCANLVMAFLRTPNLLEKIRSVVSQ